MFSIYLSNYQADQRDDGETTHTHTQNTNILSRENWHLIFPSVSIQRFHGEMIHAIVTQCCMYVYIQEYRFLLLVFTHDRGTNIISGAGLSAPFVFGRVNTNVVLSVLDLGVHG